MKVGDYIRAEDGMIAKIENFWIYHNVNFITTDKDTISESMVIKSSPNIIDLIEVGDYANGCMVINKKDDTIQIIQLIIPFDLKEKDIKSIVTKEQFKSMQYKVGE